MTLIRVETAKNELDGHEVLFHFDGQNILGRGEDALTGVLLTNLRGPDFRRLARKPIVTSDRAILEAYAAPNDEYLKSFFGADFSQFRPGVIAVFQEQNGALSISNDEPGLLNRLEIFVRQQFPELDPVYPNLNTQVIHNLELGPVKELLRLSRRVRTLLRETLSKTSQESAVFDPGPEYDDRSDFVKIPKNKVN